MSKATLREGAIQKSLELTKEEVLKVLVFIAGIEAGRELQFTEQAAKENRCGRAS